MRKRIDIWILVSVLVLFAIGYVLILSASSYSALVDQKDSFYFASRHLKFIFVGLFVILATWSVNYKIYQRGVVISIILFVTISLSILTLLIGKEVNGAIRWIDLGFFTFMPVDTAKIAIIFTLSYTLSKFRPKKNKFFALAIHGLIPFVFMLLTYLQPDTSSTMLLLVLTSAMIFIGYEPIAYLIATGVAVLVPVAFIIKADSYRVSRLDLFYKGLKDITKASDQIKYGVLAVSTGGIFGIGPGRSVFNKLYIPHAHNDLILSTLGEEYGFMGIVVIMAIYLFLIYNMIKIAVSVDNLFGKLISFGVAITFAVQIVINMGTTLGLVPPTGIPLPFLSYGGTNILVLSFMIGVILSVYRMENKE